MENKVTEIIVKMKLTKRQIRRNDNMLLIAYPFSTSIQNGYIYSDGLEQ